MRRPIGELETALRRAVRTLRAAAQRFDEGNEDDAFVMAVILRALLHYGQSPPLLHELDVIKTLSFVDTGPPQENLENVLLGGLVKYEVSTHGDSSSAGVFATLAEHEAGRTRPFTPWWKSDLVIRDERDNWHTRHFLVTEMSNTDIAHFDPFIDEDYHALKTDQGGMSATVGGIDVPLDGNVATASLRQIAWETLRTLDDQCAQILGDS